MVLAGGNKDDCLEVAAPLVVDEVKALATLFLLSLNGLWALLLLGRPSIYKGWLDTVKGLFKRKPPGEFISYDARRTSEPVSTYEMLESKQRGMGVSSPPLVPAAGPGILKSPERTLSNSTTLREYNPVTFSAQLRERGGSDPDSLSGIRTNSPFSPFKDHPEYRPPTAGGPDAPFSPYADTRPGSRAGLGSPGGPRSPGVAMMKGPSSRGIGMAQ